MQHSTYKITALLMLLASCTTNNYYLVSDGDFDHPTRLDRDAVKSYVIGKLYYDNKVPDIPKLSIIQDASRYDKYDKFTFPILGNESAVAPPMDWTQKGCTAIWCTKEATVIGHLYQMKWDMHYFQESSDSYIRDCATGEHYKVLRTGEGIPLDMSFNIQGVSGEWIFLYNVYPPLPECCTTIDIVDGDITDDVKNGASWGGGLHLRNVAVSDLQANQHIATFRKTRIIE